MEPLFGSTPPQSLPPHLRWHVPDKPGEWCGKGLLYPGGAVTLRTHRVGRRTWPCLNQWPALGRECPHCDRSTRSTTWVPVVSCSSPNQKLVFMGGETTWKSVERMEHGIIVECHFAKTLRPTLVFGKHSIQIGVGALSRAAEEVGRGRCDITRWLLHYWQWSDLSKWYNELYRESVKVRSTRERAEFHGMAPLVFPNGEKAG